MAVAQLAGEPDLQLRGTASAAATSAAPATSAAASVDADVPGWLGDPGDRRVSGAAAAASAATSGTGAGPLRAVITPFEGEQESRAGPQASPGISFDSGLNPRRISL